LFVVLFFFINNGGYVQKKKYIEANRHRAATNEKRLVTGTEYLAGGTVCLVVVELLKWGVENFRFCH
jgi:hypothetical protein